MALFIHPLLVGAALSFPEQAVLPVVVTSGPCPSALAAIPAQLEDELLSPYGAERRLNIVLRSQTGSRDIGVVVELAVGDQILGTRQASVPTCAQAISLAVSVGAMALSDSAQPSMAPQPHGELQPLSEPQPQPDRARPDRELPTKRSHRIRTSPIAVVPAEVADRPTPPDNIDRTSGILINANVGLTAGSETKTAALVGAQVGYQVQSGTILLGGWYGPEMTSQDEVAALDSSTQNVAPEARTWNAGLELFYCHDIGFHWLQGCGGLSATMNSESQRSTDSGGQEVRRLAQAITGAAEGAIRLVVPTGTVRPVLTTQLGLPFVGDRERRGQPIFQGRTGVEVLF